jgi:hypothetical protein
MMNITTTQQATEYLEKLWQELEEEEQEEQEGRRARNEELWWKAKFEELVKKYYGGIE